jgi:fibronectin-binding autotransporter adhesin
VAITVRFVAAPLLACLIFVPTVRGQIVWTGAVNTDWNTAGNWNPAVVPNNSATAVSFTGNALGTVNISSFVAAAEITFSNSTGNYTLTSSAGQSLSFGQAVFPLITVAAGVTGTETINLASVSAGSLLLPGNATAVVMNNSTAAGTTLVIGPTTVIGSNGAAVNFTGPGNTQITGSFNTLAVPIFALVNSGPGMLTFSGNGTGLTGAGGLKLNGGTLNLDYSSNTAAKLGSGPLTLGGGVFSLTANSGTPVTQAISAGTTVSVGHTDVRATGTGTLTLNAGAVTRTGPGTSDFVPGAGGLTFNVATTAGTVNGLLGTGPAFATFNNESTWATVNSGAIAGLATYATNNYTSAANNVDVTNSATLSNITVNSLRFSGSNPVLTLSGTNTLQSGGILVSGNNSGTITGGTLMASGGGELIVHQHSSATPGLTINSSIVSTAGLTKTGAGTLTLGGDNSGLTGPVNINRGGLVINGLAAVNSASGINFSDNRLLTGAQSFTIDLGSNTNAAIIPPITVAASGTNGGGTFFSTGASLNSRITLAKLSSSTTGNALQFIGDTSNTSGFNLGDATALRGSMTLADGYLGIGPLVILPSVSMTLRVGDAVAGGLDFLANNAFFSGPLAIAATTRIISHGSNTNSIDGTLTSTGSGTGFQLVKAGTGTLVFDGDATGFNGNWTLAGGTLKLVYPAAQITTTKVGSGSVTFNGGQFRLENDTSGPVTQNIPGGIVVAAGHTDIVGDHGSFASPSLTLGLGPVSRSSGATIDISATASTSLTVTSSVGATNGLTRQPSERTSPGRWIISIRIVHTLGRPPAGRAAIPGRPTRQYWTRRPASTPPGS